MKILFCIKTLDYKHGGPVEIIININKVINRKEKITYTLEYKKLSYSFLIKSIFNSKLKKKLNNFLYKYDIVHFHEIFSFKVIILSFFLRNLQKKYLFVGHGYLDKWSLNNNYWKKFLFRIFFLQRSIDGSSAFFFSTVAEYREALINYNIKKNNVFVIPNGIDLEVFADFEKKKNYRKKKIIFFGRIHEKKGIDLLINCMNLLPKKFFEKFYFEITGPIQANYKKKIQKKIQLFDMESHVQIKKSLNRNKKIDYYKNADLFILPSYEEGDSVALKEALASYLPVIISKQCRMNIVEEYDAGYVIDTNVESLKNGLMKAYDSLNHLDRMGQNSRKLIEENYNNKECVGRLLDIYLDIHSNKKISKSWLS